MLCLTNNFRKIRRLHYSFINALTPFHRLRWTLTLSIVLTYAATTKDICSDLNTYLVGFYLMMLILNYFLPRGVANHLDQSYDEDEQSLFSFNDSLDSSMVTVESLIDLEHSQDKPLLREMNQIQIWQRATIAISIGSICSYFKMLQIDVFWPLLLVYLCGLALYTVIKIAKTMKRFGYDLSDFQKQVVK